jgi:hypothetical protein
VLVFVVIVATASWATSPRLAVDLREIKRLFIVFVWCPPGVRLSGLLVASVSIFVLPLLRPSLIHVPLIDPRTCSATNHLVNPQRALSSDLSGHQPPRGRHPLHSDLSGHQPHQLLGAKVY